MAILDLNSWTRERPRVMGIINVTPDSFSDGGRFFGCDLALAQAERMIADGVDMLDLGAESTRPGAVAVSAAEELDRLGEVLQGLRGAPVPLSLDTSSPEVMREGLSQGVSLINDVRALQRPGALDVIAANPVAICLMHMLGEPTRMQHAPIYGDVVDEVETFLLERARVCQAHGVPATSIAIDPGFGFGKDFAHNHALFSALPRLSGHGFPLLVGISRKRMIGELSGRELPSERDAGSLAAHVMALDRGARILRVHAVEPTVDAVRVWAGLV
ncbi:MAG TPA: dihydropteroate synthase [bacterium]|nr:dihydropteroate synthase [bacterium]